MESAIKRVSVIGVGHLGQHHARVYTELLDARLVGIVDRDEERAHRLVASVYPVLQLAITLYFAVFVDIAGSAQLLTRRSCRIFWAALSRQ